MAAIDTAGATYPNNKKVTLSGTPNTMQEFQIPGDSERVEIQFVGASGLVVFQGGSDSATISSQVAYPVPADSSFWYQLPRSKQDHSVWVASGSASTVCHIVIYEA